MLRRGHLLSRLVGRKAQASAEDRSDQALPHAALRRRCLH